MSPYQVHFVLPGLPKTANTKERRGYFAIGREYAMWKRMVWAAICRHKPKEPLKLARVTLIRHSSRCPDFDGLVSSFKPVLDGLIDAGVIANDDCQTIGAAYYLWNEVPAKRGRISVRVEELASAAELNLSHVLRIPA